MNERIRLLAEQAHKEANGVCFRDYDLQFQKAFARLLILECINLLVTVDDHEVAKEIVYKRLGVEL